MYDGRSGHQLNLVFQFGQFFPKHFNCNRIRMTDADGCSVSNGDADQFLKLFSNKISILNMIQKDIALGKWDFQKSGGRAA